MILPLGSHLQASQEPEMSYPWRGELQRWFVVIRNSNSKHTKNHGTSSTFSMGKFIFYRGHCLILPLPCLIKDCGNELDWAPGTINSQRGLYRWLDWMMVLTTSFCQQDSKGSSKNWWLSQQLLHPLTDRMDFRQEARVSWRSWIHHDRFPWQFEYVADVPGTGLVAWGVWVHHLEILGEKGMRKIPFKSDSNLIFSIVNQSSLLKPYQVCKLETINIPMHIMHVGCSKPLIQCCHIHHEWCFFSCAPEDFRRAPATLSAPSGKGLKKSGLWVWTWTN